MNNFTVIQNSDLGVIRASLARMGIQSAHFTNGVFAGRPEILLPTNLACFKLINDRDDDGDAPFIIAVNSDESVSRLDEDKIKKGETVSAVPDQTQRANMIGKAVAATFVDRDVIVIFYDEKEPFELYSDLQHNGFGLKTLFKGNYGINPDQGQIVGAELFDTVIAFPLPHQTAKILPYAAGITEKSENPQNVEILKLTEEVGSHGRPYITEANRVLFSLPAQYSSLVDCSIKPSGSKPSQP